MNFAIENRIAEIHKNISARKEQAFDVKNNIASANIIEEEVEIDGEELVLFSFEGLGKEGVAIAKSDLDSGAITREDACLFLVEGVE